MTTDDNVIHMEYLKEFYAKFPTPAQTAMAQVSAQVRAVSVQHRGLPIFTAEQHQLLAEGLHGL